jgi:hypothetical protein
MKILLIFINSISSLFYCSKTNDLALLKLNYMKCLGIVLLLLSTSNLFSQVNKESNKSFYTEFNLVRYSNISYLLKDNKVGNSLNFLNGIKVGMKKKNTEFYLSYIKFNNETFQSNGFSGGSIMQKAIKLD